MAHRGWKHDSARHSLASRGVKTTPKSNKYNTVMKSARRRHMTIDEAEAADEAYKQLQRDLGDQDYIDAQYDLSDPDSAASINREAYMEGVEQAEAEFMGEAVSKLEEGPIIFEKWLAENCDLKYRDEVRERAAEILEEKRADESPPKSITDAEVERIEKHDKLTREYLTKNKKNWLSPEESVMLAQKAGGTVTNEMRSEAEVHNFKKEKPKQYFAYYNLQKKQVNTWMGDKLGDIVSMGREWRSNMGDRRVAITVKGINGVTYSGTAYLDAGDYARLKATKE